MSAVENPNPGAAAPPPSAPAPAPAVAPPPQAAPTAAPTKETRRDTIRTAAMHHASRQPRTDQGQFASGTPTPPTVAPDNPAPAPVISRPDMPKSLKAELRQHWDTSPVELLNDIVRRETDYTKGLETYKTRATQLDELLNEFKPYEQLIQSQNGTPASVIRNLLGTANIFHTGNPVQKVQAVAQLMQQFGIPFEQVQQLLSGQGAPAAPGNGAPAIDPQVQMLTQQVQQLTNQQKAEREARALAAIKKFASDPANKHFDSVSERVVALLHSPQVIGAEEGMSEDERLRLAYDAAIRLHPEIYQQVLAEQQAAKQAEEQAKAEKQVEQARQAAVQVKGAPASAPAPKVDPKDRKATIRRAIESYR